MDEKIRAEFFSRRFSLMQGTILGRIDKELDDDVFVKLITAYFHTVVIITLKLTSSNSNVLFFGIRFCFFSFLWNSDF